MHNFKELHLREIEQGKPCDCDKPHVLRYVVGFVCQECRNTKKFDI